MRNFAPPLSFETILETQFRALPGLKSPSAQQEHSSPESPAMQRSEEARELPGLMPRDPFDPPPPHIHTFLKYQLRKESAGA